MAMYVCETPFELDMFDDYGEQFLGKMQIQEGSVWEVSERPSDYEVLLENNETGEWVGMGKEEVKNRFKLLA